MTAMTRSASMTPSSMSLASSEASLTLCSGTLRTSIGAGTAASLRTADGLSEPRVRWSGGEDGADVVPVDRVGDVLEGGDDGTGPALLHEAEGGLHLRAHRAAGELAVGGVPAHLAGGDPAERPRRWRAEVDHHVGHVGGDDEGVGADLGAEDGSGQVLVDDGLDAAETRLVRAAVHPVVGDRDATAAGADDDEAGRDERRDGRPVDDGARLRGGDDAAPALLAAVLPDLAERDEPLGLRAGQEPADRLAGFPEARVVDADQRARDDADRAPVDAPGGEGGVELVGDGEGEGGLGLGDAPVQRHRRDDVRRELVLDQ